MKRILLIFTATLAIFIIMLIAFYHFTDELAEHARNDTKNAVEAVLQSEADNLYFRLSESVQLTELVADSLDNIAAVNQHDIEHRLEQAESNTLFKLVILAYPDGQAFDCHGHYIDVSHNAAFQKAMLGTTSVSYGCGIVDPQAIMICSPIITAGKVRGVILAELNMFVIIQLLNTASLRQESYTEIIDSHGQLILKSPSPKSIFKDADNIFPALEAASFQEGRSADQIRLDLTEQASGYTIYNYHGHQRYCSYMPIKINDWYILRSVTDKLIDHNIAPVRQMAGNMLLKIVVLLTIAVLLFCYIVYWMKKTARNNQLLASKIRLDTMTGLYNKAYIRQHITSEIQQRPNNCQALLICDINKFKHVNDAYGHIAGDEAIISLARLLKEHFFDNGTVGRIGGDEFIIYINDAGNYERLQAQIIALQQRISYLRFQNGDFSLTISIGAVIGSRFIESDYDTIFIKADENMYIAKRKRTDHLLITSLE
jgi:diguanylate cyclase (GGDEF)-like protein